MPSFSAVKTFASVEALCPFEHARTTRVSEDAPFRHHVLQTKFMSTRYFVQVEVASTRNTLRCKLFARITGSIGHEPGSIQDSDIAGRSKLAQL